MRDGLEEPPVDAAAAGADAPVELSVVGADPSDPSVLLLEAPDGRRFRLPVGSRLRAAVRSAGPVTGPVPAVSEPLRPRDIQARIRAGETAADVAADAGVPLEQVQRYEGPVLAERAHVANLARLAVVRGGPGRLTLEEAVRSRLLARGADPGSAAWDAWRRDGGWAVQVAFRAAGRDRSAQWSFAPSNRVLEPLDDEARWLTAPSDDPTGRRLAAVRVYDVEAEDARLDGGHEPGSGPASGQGSSLSAGAAAPPVAFEPSPPTADRTDRTDRTGGAGVPLAPPVPRGPAPSPSGPPVPELDDRDDVVAASSGAPAGGVHHHAPDGTEDDSESGSEDGSEDAAAQLEGPAAADDLASRTLDLLDALRDRRGRRVPLDLGPDGEPWDDEEDDDLLNALLDLPPGSDPDALELQEEVDRARARLRMVTPPRGLQLPRQGEDGPDPDAADEPPAPSGPRASLGLVPAPPPTEPVQVTPAPPAPAAAGTPRETPRDGDLDGELLRREPATRRERWRGADAQQPVPPPAPAPAPSQHPEDDDARQAPSSSRGVPGPDGVEDPEHDGDDPGEQPARRRRSVPSWDEIVFGAPRRD